MCVCEYVHTFVPPPIDSSTHSPQQQRGHGPTRTATAASDATTGLALWPRLVAEIEAIDCKLLLTSSQRSGPDAPKPQPAAGGSASTWGEVALCRLCGMVLQRVARSGSLFAPTTMRAVVKVCVCVNTVALRHTPTTKPNQQHTTHNTHHIKNRC